VPVPARAIFGLLVLATAAALLGVQRLRTSEPVVNRVFFTPNYVSPNSDGRDESTRVSFKVRKSENLTLSIVDDRGDEVRKLVDDRRMSRGIHQLSWDGRDDDGRVVDDGAYRVRATIRSEGRSTVASREAIVDTKPPRPRLEGVEPALIVPGARGRGRARVSYDAAGGTGARFTVYRTSPGRVVPVARFVPGSGGTGVWNGRVGTRPAPVGTYLVAVTVRDRAGNEGSSPAVLPPTRAAAVQGDGVSVRYLSATAPSTPVRAGEVARLTVGPIPRRFRWSLTRVGAGTPIRRGTGAGTRLAFRVPPRARTGVHLVRVATGGRSAVAPIAVRGARSGPVLVVVPAITWQGRNPVDDDRDGFPDTLDAASAVLVGRPFAGVGFPQGFAREITPLAHFLDTVRARYDLTTDLALATGRGPRIRRRPGVVLAGTERWLPENVNLALRRYVEQGGKVASFGTDALRRRVSVTPRRLTDPSPPEPDNVFGERTAPLTIPPAPMVVNGDRLELFAGTDGYVGLFSRFEQSNALVSGTRVLAAAGRDAKHPSFVAYRLRDGLVIRAGSPEWGAQLASRSEVQSVTRRIWTLLSR